MTILDGMVKPESGQFRAAKLFSPVIVALFLSVLSALMVAAWPLGLTGDYLNHLARAYIEGEVWFSPALQRYYTVSVSVVPDLAMDMVIPWLSHLTGPYAAGAVMVWMALAAPPLAGLAVARSVHGRVTWLSLLGSFGAFNQNAQWGFVNFLVSTAVAIAGFALWTRLAPDWRRTLIFAPFGILLAFCHALGFLLFGYLVLFWELGSFASGRRGPATTFIRGLATWDALAMLPGLLVLAAATRASGGLPQEGAIDFAMFEKIASIWSGSMFFNMALAKAVTIALVCAVWIGLRRKMLSIELRMAWVCGGLLVLVIVMPTTAAGIWGLHFRYPAALIILTAASLRVETGLSARDRKLFAVSAIALLAVIHFNASRHMAQVNARMDSLRTMVSNIKLGSRVLSSRSEPMPNLTLHSDAMAVIDRSAYVPGLFTNTSPVGVQHALHALHMPQSWPVTSEQLESSAGLPLPPSKNGLWSPTYYYGWPKHWDYVLYFRERSDEKLDSPFLCPVSEAAKVVLYQVTGDACAARPGEKQG